MARALVRLFLRNDCTMDPSLTTDIEDLHVAYAGWLTRKGIADVSGDTPYLQLSRLFVVELRSLKPVKGHKGKVFHGIGIKGAPPRKRRGRPSKGPKSEEPIAVEIPQPITFEKVLQPIAPAPVKTVEPIAIEKVPQPITFEKVLQPIAPVPIKTMEPFAEFPSNTKQEPLQGSTGSGGYIYFVRTKDTHLNPFMCKIGKTRNLAHRLSTLQTGSQEILECIAYVHIERNVIMVEHEIHAELKSLRAHGEWFSITKDQIKEVCAWIARRKLSLEVPIITALGETPTGVKSTTA